MATSWSSNPVLKVGANVITLADYGIHPHRSGEDSHLSFTGYKFSGSSADLYSSYRTSRDLDSPGPSNGFNVEVTATGTDNIPTEVTVTVPSGFPVPTTGKVSIQCLTYPATGARHHNPAWEYTITATVSTDSVGDAAPGGIVAPNVFNITATTASFSCPSTLVTPFVAYSPQYYEPSSGTWLSAGDDCIGGEVVIVGGLSVNTSGYKVRFVGTPDPSVSLVAVNGASSTAFTTTDDPGPSVCSAYAFGKAVSSEYMAMLSSSPTTRALLIKITRQDGKVFAYTTASEDIDGSNVLESGVAISDLDGVTFLSKGGMSPTGVANSVELSRSDNLDVEALITDDGILDSDINSGLFDGAAMLICEVNYEDLTQGVMRHKKGYLGKTMYDEIRFQGTFNSLSQKLSSPILERGSLTCRVQEFGDTRCKLSLSGTTVDGYNITNTGAVTAIDTDEPARIITISGISSIPDGYFNYGRLTVTQADSLDYNVTRKIRLHSASQIQLAEELPFVLSIGDTVTVVMGCDRRGETCAQRFANKINFRGEDHTPGVNIYDVVSS